jgi:capsular exopolysaccharide synthesis family protein
MSSKLPIPHESNGGMDPFYGRLSPPPGPAGAPPKGGGVEQMARRVLSSIWRYKWMVLILVVLGTGAGYVFARFQRPLYEARSQVWIHQPGMIGGGGGGPIQQGSLLGVTAWRNLLISATVMDSVVRQRRLYLNVTTSADSMAFWQFEVDKQMLVPGLYRLSRDPAGSGFVLSDGQGQVLERGTLGDSVGRAVGLLWQPQASMVPVDRPIEFLVMPPSEVNAELSNRLRTNQGLPGQDQSLLRISLQGSNRRNVAGTLEAVMKRFEEVALNLKQERLRQTSEILQEQLRQAEEDLTQAEAALSTYRVNTVTLPNELRGVGAPIAAGVQLTDNTVYGNYFQMNMTRDQLARDREIISNVLQGENSISGMVTALENIPSAKASRSLMAALADAANAEATLRVARMTMTDEHPQVKMKIAEIDSLKTKVIPRYSNELMGDLARRQSELDGQITTAATEMRQIPVRQIREDQLAGQAAIARELHDRLETAFQTAKLAEISATPDITVVDWPSVPFTPVADPRRMMLMAFFGGSLALGIMLAILRDRLDSRLQYPDQVTGGMGLNILGAVPALRSGRLGAEDMALAVESFRSIQLSLMHTSENGGPLTVTFTSPGASDGKSFVTSNLAIAFADMGHRTLVIDGDVRRGSMHRLLGTRHKPGLTDYLAGKVSRGEIIQETNYPMLQVIGCGSRGEAGPKLLGSPTMRELMRDLRPDYDVILVDSPPLGACVDPMILGTLTRNLVLVLRTGSTDRALAESKLDVLDRLPVRVVGAILNDVSQNGQYRYYSYIAGYEVLEEEDAEQLPAGIEEKVED